MFVWLTLASVVEGECASKPYTYRNTETVFMGQVSGQLKRIGLRCCFVVRVKEKRKIEMKRERESEREREIEGNSPLRLSFVVCARGEG
jgi:hypothetical protein